MKKFLVVLLLLGAVVGGLAVYIHLQPSDFRVERSATMKAPAAAVFDQINSFRKWEKWSPWAELDKNAKNEFQGPESGKDAVFKWSGNNDVGEGMMTILESKPHESIRIKLDFKRPMEDTSTVDFTFTPSGDQTKVTWLMFGKQNFMGKAMGVVMNMDKMIGDSFEKGLASIKGIVESQKTDTAAKSDAPKVDAAPKTDAAPKADNPAKKASPDAKDGTEKKDAAKKS